MASQKILIVDDSRMIRMQIKDMLPGGNYEILEAGDGVEALEVITQNRPNLLLVDFFMPRMNGWEVVQKIQDHPKFKNIPVVMMSGRREDVEKAVPELFSYFEFLNKPFEQDVLIKAIKLATTKAKHRQKFLDEAPVTAHSLDQAIAPDPHQSESTPNSPDEIAQLKAQVQHLQEQNSKLHNELETVKKQITQIAAFIRQKVR